MESCMMKPEEKKKTKSKLPPWPPETSKNEAEILEKPTPVVPPRPKYNELSQTQYRLKRLETNGEAGPTVSQTETKEKKPEPPVPAPRRAEQERNRTSRHSQRDSDDKRISAGSAQSDASDDPKQSHVTDDQDRGDDAPDKRASANKPGVLKGVMKHLRSGPKVAGGEAAPEADKDDAASEKERPAGDKAKHDKSSESKQEFGSLLTGMFRKPPVVTVGNVDSDSEANEDDEKPSERSNAGGIFNGIFKKKPAEGPQPDEEQPDSGDNLSQKSSSEEKGGFFGGILRKSPKIPKETPAEQDAEELRGNLSGSSDSLSENKEKGGLFSGFLKKTPKVGTEESTLAQKEMSASDDSLSDAPKAKEKGSAFGGMFKKSPRPADSEEPQDDERSVGGDGASEENKEKGGIFAGFFKKAAKAPQSEQDESEPKKLSASSENLAEGKAEKDRARFGGFFKKTPKGDRLESSDGEEDDEQPAAAGAKGDDDDAPKTANKDKNLFSNMFKKPPKPAEGDKEAELKSEGPTSGSSENLPENVPKGKKGGLAGIFKRTYSSDKLVDEDKEKSASNDNLLENANAKDKEKSIFSGIFKKAPKLADEAVVDEDSKGGEEKKLLASDENLTEENTAKEKSGGLAGMFKKSPQPAPRSIATKDPLSDDREAESVKDDLSGDELSGSSVNLVAGTAKEKKGVFTSMFKRTPKTADKENDGGDKEDGAPPGGGGLRRRRTIKRKRRVVSFRVKTTLPRMPKIMASSQAQEKMPLIEESVEMQEMIPTEESTVEVQPLELAAYPTEGNPLESEEENDGLLEWWKNVEGWAEWNEAANFQEDEEGIAMEEAADRVYMAARLFVRLFNQRGASLQQSILELLAIADAADQFHKKTVSAAVGGGVASVAGSLATITGLILAPFTFGASIIVTAVGISVATAGSITSATANITDAVHSNMDRKKVEKMIQDYQEQIKDIRECMDFVQEGIDTLQEWDFEKYSQSAAKKALNHNIKHVVKEGGRAGKALMINTDKLISTVQVLGAGAGAAKAAQAISVTTGVMSALFLALDVFFLAKDSHELRKGAKTKFASKIRDVCKELQNGLLELNKVKTQLQKTMDGIEVEEYEEIEEVEVEVDDDLESDPKKLAALEQELDLLEEKLDKRIEEGKNTEKESESKEKTDGTRKKDKLDKENENRIAASKEPHKKGESALCKKLDLCKKVDEKAKEKANTGKEPPRTGDSRGKPELESSHREHGGKEPLGPMEDSRRKEEHERSYRQDRAMTGNPELTQAINERVSHERRSNRSSKNESNTTDRTQEKDWKSEGTDSRGWDREKGMSGDSHRRRDERRFSDRSHESYADDSMEEKIAASQRSHHRRSVEEEVRGDETRRSRLESARYKFEKGGKDEEKHRGSTESHRRGSDRGEAGSNWERRASDKDKTGSDRERRGSDREHKQSRQSSHRSSVLRDDGLYI